MRRAGLRAALPCAVLVALAGARPASAQEDPTPFWMPPAPAQRPAQKPAKKKPVQVEPLHMKRKTPAPERPEDAPRPARRAGQVAPSRSVRPDPDRARLEPQAEPHRVSPEPQRARPEPQRARTDKERARPEPKRAVEPDAPLSTRRPVAPRTPAPAPPPPTVVPLDEPGARGPPPIVVEPPSSRPRPEDDEPRAADARWSADAALGLWGKSSATGAGSSYDLAYGLRLGYALLPALELDFAALRAGGSSGNPFANASATHNLFALRAFWRLPAGRFTLLAGGGAGAVLAQTHYSLHDVGTQGSGLDATSARLVLQLAAAGRARIYRGLTARAEVSGLLRDGRLEFVPLFGLGAAF